MPALLTEGLLKGHPFVQGCTEEFLNHLEEFSSEAHFERGEIILQEGHYADRCYLLRKGHVQVELADVDGTPVMIQTLEPGDLLGWSWLYPPYQWHFTARAVEDCEMIVLNAASLLIRAEEDPVFGYELMKRISLQLIHRLQMTRDRLLSEMRRKQRKARRAV